MEALHTILKKIQNHHEEEVKLSAQNKAVGRAFITTQKNGGHGQQIWITNRESKRTSINATDITGAYRGTIHTGITDTYTGDGSVTSKNSVWGRKLLENYKGKDYCMAPAGRIDFTIHNSSIFNPNSKEVSNIRVGMSDFNGYRNFKSIQEAFKRLKEGADELEKKKAEELAVRQETERLKAESERKQHELAEKLQMIKDEEEARKIEEERQKEEEKRKEKLRLEQEHLAKLEQERLEYEKRLNGLIDEYKNSVSFIRTQATLRLNPVLDILQNNIKFSHIYDGVSVVIDGGPGTGKTTTLIQRLKYLISQSDLEDYNLNNPEDKLSEEQLNIVTNNTSNWIFFSPTEVLRQYLRENMNYEGLSDTDNKTVVYNTFLQRSLRDNYDLFGDGKPFDYRSKRFKGTIMIKDDQLKVVRKFTSYYLQTIKRVLLDVANLEVSQFKWRNIGQIIIYKCKESEKVENFKDLCRILFSLSDLKSQQMPGNLLSISDIINEYNEKIRHICTSYISQWQKDTEFYKGLLDLLKVKQDLETDDEDDMEDDEEISSSALEVQLLQQLKSLIRKLALQQLGVKIKLGKKSSVLYDRLSDRINLEELNSLGECAFFVQKIYNPVIRNYEQLLFSRIPRIYKDYRREILKRGSVQWNQSLLKEIVEKNKNKLLHPNEQSLLLGFINHLVVSINKVSGIRFQQLKHKYAIAYKTLCRPVIGIDEATDYCLMDYYAIASLKHYKVSSFAMTGDIMQGLRQDGIDNWKVLEKDLIFPKLDVMPLNVSYRQSPEMLALAKKIYFHSMHKEATYKCYLSGEEETPRPLWIKSDDEEEKAEWITNRIIEVKKAYGALPSIAVFVSNQEDAKELKDELEDLGRLESQAISVVDCSGGDKLSEKDTVRIFPLDLVKGMEFEVVFFHNIDKVVNSLLDRYLYVGLSRATFFMGVTSSEESNESCQELEPMFDFTGDWSQVGHR